MRPELPHVCQVMRCVKDGAHVHPVVTGSMLSEVALCDEHVEELRVWLEEQLGVPVAAVPSREPEGEA